MAWGNVKEAALACGLPVQSWRNWERDGRLPRDYVNVCHQIAERTGVDLGWLAGLPVSGGDILGAAPTLTRKEAAAESKCTQTPAKGTARRAAAQGFRGTPRLNFGRPRAVAVAA